MYFRAGYGSGNPALPASGSIRILSAHICVICGPILLHPQKAQMNAEGKRSATNHAGPLRARCCCPSM
jgi:hypothetical protein